MTLWDRSWQSILWIDRPAGLFDSPEGVLVERFLSDYRPDDLPCLPRLLELPAGYRAGATMRIDCDEAIASARPLVERCLERGVSPTLALKTSLPVGPAERALVRETLAAGGAIVPHSVRHLPRWGGAYRVAATEAGASKAWVEATFPAAGRVRHTVSPFHQNPRFSVRALARSGYDAFVSGLAGGEPEYLLGRGGCAPFSRQPIVTHSQQVMLHGDLVGRDGGDVVVAREAFAACVAAGSLFGYLDHPFSDRYAYGWPSERARLQVHDRLIDRIQIERDVWLPSLTDALDHLVRRSRARLRLAGGRVALDVPATAAGTPRVAIQWRGRQAA